jgi:hypothetical protein
MTVRGGETRGSRYFRVFVRVRPDARIDRTLGNPQGGASFSELDRGGKERWRVRRQSGRSRLSSLHPVQAIGMHDKAQRARNEAAMKFGTPFYRMKITEKWRSAQHEMLLELDAGPNEVFYAAPLFHTVEELNEAYLAGTVSDQSCYVRPGKIGKLDGDPHHVAFDAKRFWVCSDPREIAGVDGPHLPVVLEDRLNHRPRPFGGAPLNEALEFVEEILQRREISATFHDEPSERAVDPRLQRLADISLQCFGAQLFLVQRRTAQGSL